MYSVVHNEWLETDHLITLDCDEDSDTDLSIGAVKGEIKGTQPDGLPIRKESKLLEFNCSYNKEGEERSVSVYLTRNQVQHLVSEINGWYHQ